MSGPGRGLPELPSESQLSRVIRGPTVAVSVCIHAAMGAIWVGMLLFMAPRFAGMFANLGAELPVVTRAVLSLAQTMRQLWPLLAVVGVALLALDAYLMTLIGKKIRFLGALGWNSMVMIVLAALALATLLAMYLPVFTAVEAL